MSATTKAPPTGSTADLRRARDLHSESGSHGANSPRGPRSADGHQGEDDPPRASDTPAGEPVGDRDDDAARSPVDHGAVVLSLHDVAVRYAMRGRLFTRGRRGRWALRGVTFDVFAGETLGVVGRNGAGKSTLLRLLAGIVGPDRGRVEKRHAGRASLLSLQVGFLPQLTGRENAILSGMLLGLRRREVLARLGAIAAFAELEAVIDDPISTYSDGMRARLGFATALHADPDILLIDEALGTGDAAFHEKSAAAMRARIRSDRTCVLVSHDAATIRELCDRCVWIENGVVAASGAPDEVLGAYEAALRS